MDLIERYLGAVRWNLPADKADDIVAELADLIHARIEDREEALDRALTKDELSALLREFGHPLSVAGQYHGQQSLIGPETFPFYWFVLRVWLAVVAVIEAIEFVGRVTLGSAPFAQALSQGVHGAVEALLMHAAIVTIAFAVIERSGWLASYLARWKPEDLPDFASLPEMPTLRAMPVLQAPKLRRRQLWDAAFAIVFGIAFLLWWSGSIALPFAPRDADVVVRAAPVWAGLYWPVVVLVWLGIVHGLVTLLRPGWRLVRGALVVANTAGTLAIAAVLHGAGRIVLVTGADAAEAVRIQDSIDRSIEIALAIVAIAMVCHCATELWRLYRER
jgi:hypothetical protein